MKAKHIKVWLDTIQREEKAARANPGREADPGPVANGRSLLS